MSARTKNIIAFCLGALSVLFVSYLFPATWPYWGKVMAYGFAGFVSFIVFKLIERVVLNRKASRSR